MGYIAATTPAMPIAPCIAMSNWEIRGRRKVGWFAYTRCECPGGIHFLPDEPTAGVDLWHAGRSQHTIEPKRDNLRTYRCKERACEVEPDSKRELLPIR